MGGTVNIVPPAIDPLAPKNMALSPEDASYVCQQFGIDVDRPLICQVSRFDPWKDPLGVIDAYRIVKESMPEVQLALVGSMASDDPEGWDFFNATIAHAAGDPDIHILNNFNNVGAIEVNAFQSHADVVIQKSTREGFGLTVTEAIWKGRPFIGGDVGGIPLQVQNGISGYLVGLGRRVRRALPRQSSRTRRSQGAGPPRQGARAQALPDAALPARLPEDHLAGALVRDARTASSARYEQGAPPRPGLQPGPRDLPARRRDEARHGGLVTALTGLASHREVLWVASAMTDEGRRARRAARRRAVRRRGARRRLVPGAPRRVRRDAYDRFYNVFANPMLWFIQHYLWDLSNAPDIRRNEVEAFEYGYNVVNDDLAEAVVEEIDGQDEPVVMVHDYHLYTLPALVRRARPDAFLHHFIHIPWTQPDAWRVLPRGIRREIFEGLLANDIIGFHTRSYRWNFLQCCRDLMDLDVDFGAGSWRSRPRGLGARVPAADRRGRDRPRRLVGAHERVRGDAARPPARAPDPARRPRRPVEERPARVLGRSTCSSSSTPSSTRRSRSSRSSCRRGPTCPSTRSTSSASRRSSRSSTTATARRTGCRSSSSCATTSRRRWPPTSTTTSCWSTRCSTA
jgi:hypothetical protein